ncbi:hypothetical protein [uncultured Novosphingobium sp.]|uniref:hypothetical protein n=1 Tax=uncultured Novosphingobium sp. TaxID=292277 RepID=UPI002583028A|nr:hypothetical protein [uncultured Novosphingobium sp.]
MTIYLTPESGLLMMALAVALLRLGWKVNGHCGNIRVASGWIVLLVALFLLAAALGTLVGLTVATLAFGLCGYGAVILNSERRPLRKTPERISSQDTTPQRRGHGWGRGSAAILLTMGAAIAVGAAAAGLPICLPVNRVTIGGLVLPLVWAGLIIWVLSDMRLRRAVLGLCTIIGASGLLITVEFLA